MIDSLVTWTIAIVVVMAIAIVLGVSYKFFKSRKDVRDGQSRDREGINFARRLATAVRFKTMRDHSDLKDVIIKELNDSISKRLDIIEEKIKILEKGDK